MSDDDFETWLRETLDTLGAQADEDYCVSFGAGAKHAYRWLIQKHGAGKCLSAERLKQLLKPSASLNEYGAGWEAALHKIRKELGIEGEEKTRRG